LTLSVQSPTTTAREALRGGEGAIPGKNNGGEKARSFFDKRRFVREDVNPALIKKIRGTEKGCST